MENSGKSQTLRPPIAARDDDRAQAGVPARVQECGEIAGTRLAIAFSGALTEATEQLLTKSASGGTRDDAGLWQQAATFARNRREEMVESFRKHFEGRYDQACQRKSALLNSSIRNFDARLLQIVEHEVLDSGLDAYPLAEAIRTSTWNTLHDLTQWFREHLADPEMPPNDMPLGPKLIAAAFVDAVSDQFGGHEIKRRVLQALCRLLPISIDLMYRDLIAHLVVAGETSSAAADSAIGQGEEPPEDLGAVTTSEPVAGPSAAEPVDPCTDADRVAAEQIIGPCLAGKRLPGFIAEFLDGPWRAWLSRVHGVAGPASLEWSAARQTMDDLLNSLRTKRSADEYTRLMGELPELVSRLGEVLEAVGEPIEARHRFFAHLAEYHVRLVRAAKERVRNAEAGTAGPTPDARVQEPPDAELQTLNVGVWLETQQPYMSSRKLKLAWISPNRSLFLLTNHLGERALSLGPRDLADMLRSGAARILPASAEPASGGRAAPTVQARKTA